MKEQLFYVIFASVVAGLLTITIASLVAFIKTFHPVEQTGTEEDEVLANDSVFQHIINCGLIYPAVYTYAWILIWASIR